MRQSPLSLSLGELTHHLSHLGCLLGFVSTITLVNTYLQLGGLRNPKSIISVYSKFLHSTQQCRPNDGRTPLLS